MAEPPPLDDVDVGRADAMTLTKLEQYAQEIKSTKAALLDQKELYRQAVRHLAAEKDRNKALEASFKELQSTQNDVSSPVQHDVTHSVAAVTGEEVHQSDLQSVRSLQDNIRAWEAANALNLATIEQLKAELIVVKESKENALRLLEEANGRIRLLEDEAKQLKGSPKEDRSLAKQKSVCSPGKLADLEATIEAFEMNLDVARRNLNESEQLRALDARRIDELQKECERLALGLTAKEAELETTRRGGSVAGGVPEKAEVGGRQSPSTRSSAQVNGTEATRVHTQPEEKSPIPQTSSTDSSNALENNSVSGAQEVRLGKPSEEGQDSLSPPTLWQVDGQIGSGLEVPLDGLTEPIVDPASLEHPCDLAKEGDDVCVRVQEESPINYSNTTVDNYVMDSTSTGGHNDGHEDNSTTENNSTRELQLWDKGYPVEDHCLANGSDDSPSGEQEGYREGGGIRAKLEPDTDNSQPELLLNEEQHVMNEAKIVAA